LVLRAEAHAVGGEGKGERYNKLGRRRRGQPQNLTTHGRLKLGEAQVQRPAPPSMPRRSTWLHHRQVADLRCIGNRDHEAPCDANSLRLGRRAAARSDLCDVTQPAADLCACAATSPTGRLTARAEDAPVTLLIGDEDYGATGTLSFPTFTATGTGNRQMRASSQSRRHLLPGLFVKARIREWRAARRHRGAAAGGDPRDRWQAIGLGGRGDNTVAPKTGETDRTFATIGML
jgi:hypothetical protein